MIEKTIALILFLCFSIPIVYLSIKGRIPLKRTITLLVFSLITGFVVCNHDMIYKIKGLGLEIETAKKEITGFKISAIEEISKEVKGQKESIGLLISNANNTSEKIEKQKEALGDLIRKASDLQAKIEDQRKKLIALNESAEKTKKDMEMLNYASEQIALILVRVNYLTLETKGDFGTVRAKKAIQEVEKDLGKLLTIIIPNEDERSAWVKSLKKTLPSAER